MLFNSFSFLIFFPIVLIIYFVIPRKVRYIWLLLASYYFYMSWNPKYAVLLAFATIITWGGGILIGCKERKLYKKVFLFLTLAANLSMLCFFKLSDFILDEINSFVQGTGMHLLTNPFDFLLPIGISFYTLQALGYTIDVYRGEIDSEKNILKYALFVSFFPQLLAGPIERSKNLLIQVKEIETINLYNFDRVVRGGHMMLWGFFMKMVIADRLAILVETTYGNYTDFNGYQLAIATVCFGMQIYCDFAGYSLIAIGAAKIMGFNIIENFSTPYLAMSIKDFWSRWHISLSTWFRDYLYIPLGGNRCSKLRHYFNLMLTFLIAGLWHGANWTFIIWGGIHGAFCVIGKITEKVRQGFYDRIGISNHSVFLSLGRICTTFVIVNFAWVFFRAETIKQAKEIVIKIFTQFNISELSLKQLLDLGLIEIECYILAISLVALVIVDVYKFVRNQSFLEWVYKRNIVIRFALYILCICMIYVFGVYGPGFETSPFLYYRF